MIEALQKKKKEILFIWIDRTLDSYVSSGFFKKSRDKFANPVGANIREGLSRIFELLIGDKDQKEMVKPLDQVIRIRAVQDFSPAQAVAPILELKWVVKQVFATDKATRPMLSEMDSFDCDVDRLALTAFDMYMNCREQLYKNRVRELKSGRYILTDSACASALIKKNQQEITRLH
ncbi:MAG TPA: hypothetical protein ENK96_02805 [Desulfobulbaceae bacterium]|nr:hypothetical protein [Desulfobulbaceae bacterium]